MCVSGMRARTQTDTSRQTHTDTLPKGKGLFLSDFVSRAHVALHKWEWQRAPIWRSHGEAHCDGIRQNEHWMWLVSRADQFRKGISDGSCEQAAYCICQRSPTCMSSIVFSTHMYPDFQRYPEYALYCLERAVHVFDDVSCAMLGQLSGTWGMT